MKKYLTIILAGLLAGLSSMAYGQTPQTGVNEIEDSVAVHRIFSGMPSNVRINQPESVLKAFSGAVGATARRGHSANSFSIRIYSNSGRSSREESAVAIARFQDHFPDITATRTFNSPYFMVTAGQYTSRADAEKALKDIKAVFPRAYIVRK